MSDRRARSRRASRQPRRRRRGVATGLDAAGAPRRSTDALGARLACPTPRRPATSPALPEGRGDRRRSDGPQVPARHDASRHRRSPPSSRPRTRRTTSAGSRERMSRRCARTSSRLLPPSTSSAPATGRPTSSAPRRGHPGKPAPRPKPAGRAAALEAGTSVGLLHRGGPRSSTSPRHAEPRIRAATRYTTSRASGARMREGPADRARRARRWRAPEQRPGRDLPLRLGAGVRRSRHRRDRAVCGYRRRASATARGKIWDVIRPTTRR